MVLPLEGGVPQAVSAGTMRMETDSERRGGGWLKGARHPRRFNVDHCLVFDDVSAFGS
jgi:hypothetical protein